MNINYEVNRLINFAIQNNLIDKLDAWNWHKNHPNGFNN